VTKLDLQYDLLNGTPASASPPQANFVRTEQYVNQELINRDGSVAMAAQLKLIGDPLTALDAAPKQYVDSYMPIGSIIMFGGGTAPAGGRWLLCDGTDKQQSEYPDLYAVIGTAYTPAGAAPGHFSLPNMTQKFPVGSSPTNALGTTGGSPDAIVAPHVHTVDHTHAATSTAAELAGHTHTLSATTGIGSPDHAHYLGFGNLYRQTGLPPDNVNTFAMTIGFGTTINMELINSSTIPTGGTTANHTHGVSGATGDRSAQHSHGVQAPTFNGNSGPASGAAATTTGANMPPYITVNYLIRAL
jgi:microcystin-dependent protein